MTKKGKICPTKLDVSDKNFPKIARYVRQMCQTKMKTKCKICLTGHHYNFQALRRAFKPTYSNYTSILFNTYYNKLGSWATYVSNYMLLDKSNVHACAWCMRIGIICVFKENTNKTQTIFCRTYPAVFRHSCRTNLALSDISCVFWSFLSDTSSCGHIWLCRTYLAGTRPGVRFNAGLNEVSYNFEECFFRTVCCMDKR